LLIEGYSTQDTTLIYKQCPRPGSDDDNHIHALHVHCGLGESIKDQDIACVSSCKLQTTMSPSPAAAAVVSHPLYAIALLSEADELTGHNADAEFNYENDRSGGSVSSHVASSRG
jgi:hypothetical protein